MRPQWQFPAYHQGRGGVESEAKEVVMEGFLRAWARAWADGAGLDWTVVEEVEKYVGGLW